MLAVITSPDKIVQSGRGKKSKMINRIRNQAVDIIYCVSWLRCDGGGEAALL